MFAKLMSLWGVMVFAQKFIHQKKIIFFGDSLVVTRWINNEGELSNIKLESWQQKIRKRKESFMEVFISHVYREFNTILNSLSNEAIYVPLGELSMFL